MGRMTRSTFKENDNNNIISTNVHIGDIVGTDAIPFKSYGGKYDNLNLFIDKKSGYNVVIFFYLFFC